MHRVVLEHTQGPYPGIRQIGGRWEPPFPAHLGPLEAMGRRVAAAVLVRVGERLVLYREVE